MKLRNLFVVAALAAPVSLLAQAPAPAAPESPWSGSVTLGYLATSGNTETSTLNTGLEVAYTKGNWVHGFDGSAINATENNVKTAESYSANWRSERNFTDQDFMFGRLSWRKNLFSAYNTQFSQTIGYGRRLIDSDKHKLNGEIGAGARQSETQDGLSENETVFRGGAYYKWLFSETAKFSQDLTVEAGDLNTYVESVTALSAQLLGELALVASYTVKHNTDVAPTTEKTDTYTAISLEYSF